MKVSEAMCRPVSSCTEDTSLASVGRLMERDDCGALPVLRDGRVIGIVTDRDVCMALGRGTAAAAPIQKAMQTDVATCATGDDVRDALSTMGRRQVRRLPVLDEHGKLAGILSMDDLILKAEEMDPSRLPPAISCREVVHTLRTICGSRRVRRAASVAI
jgi:CBS-domain-containing membrane protein